MTLNVDYLTNKSLLEKFENREKNLGNWVFFAFFFFFPQNSVRNSEYVKKKSTFVGPFQKPVNAK